MKQHTASNIGMGVLYALTIACAILILYLVFMEIRIQFSKDLVLSENGKLLIVVDAGPDTKCVKSKQGLNHIEIKNNQNSSDILTLLGLFIAAITLTAAIRFFSFVKETDSLSQKLEEKIKEHAKLINSFDEFRKLNIFQTDILLQLTNEMYGLTKLSGIKNENLKNTLTGIALQFFRLIVDRADFRRLNEFHYLLPQYKDQFKGDNKIYNGLAKMKADPDCPDDLREKLKYILPLIKPDP